MPFDFVIGEALGEAESHLLGPMGEAEAVDALQTCLTQGLLRLMGRADLEEIQSILAAGGFFGPVYGSPGVGEVDFTVEGAALYQELGKELCGNCPDEDEHFHVQDGARAHIYHPTFDAARNTVEDYQSYMDFPPWKDFPKVVSVSVPVQLGPWCVYWWRRFPSGFRVDVDFDKAPW
jgi:hypothetical protein